MEYDIPRDMRCAMRHAMMLISNGGGVDQIYYTTPLPQHSTRGSCPATPTLDCSTFTTGTLTMGITSLVKGLQLFSPGSAVTNISHCKVVDPIAAKRRRNPPLHQRLRQPLDMQADATSMPYALFTTSNAQDLAVFLTFQP